MDKVEHQRWWYRDEAIAFARELEELAAQHDFHVAMTGGCLYKDGPRKDADFVIYRHNTPESIDTAGNMQDRRATFERKLGTCSGATFLHYGYLTKVKLPDGRGVDLLYPELRRPGEEYQNQDIGPVRSMVLEDWTDDIAF